MIDKLRQAWLWLGLIDTASTSLSSPADNYLSGLIEGTTYVAENVLQPSRFVIDSLVASGRTNKVAGLATAVTLADRTESHAMMTPEGMCLLSAYII